MNTYNNIYGDPTPGGTDLSGVEKKLDAINNTIVQLNDNISNNFSYLIDAIKLLNNPIFETAKEILAATNLEYCGKSVRDVIRDGLVNSERLIDEYNKFISEINNKSEDKKYVKI